MSRHVRGPNSVVDDESTFPCPDKYLRRSKAVAVSGGAYATDRLKAKLYTTIEKWPGLVIVHQVRCVTMLAGHNSI